MANNTERLHDETMAALSEMSLDDIKGVCGKMDVALPSGDRANDKDKVLDALCDASWCGLTLEERSDFDVRLAALVGVK